MKVSKNALCSIPLVSNRICTNDNEKGLNVFVHLPLFILFTYFLTSYGFALAQLESRIATLHGYFLHVDATFSRLRRSRESYAFTLADGCDTRVHTRRWLHELRGRDGTGEWMNSLIFKITVCDPLVWSPRLNNRYREKDKNGTFILEKKMWLVFNLVLPLFKVVFFFPLEAFMQIISR